MRDFTDTSKLLTQFEKYMEENVSNKQPQKNKIKSVPSRRIQKFTSAHIAGTKNLMKILSRRQTLSPTRDSNDSTLTHLKSDAGYSVEIFLRPSHEKAQKQLKQLRDFTTKLVRDCIKTPTQVQLIQLYNSHEHNTTKIISKAIKVAEKSAEEIAGAKERLANLNEQLRAHIASESDIGSVFQVFRRSLEIGKLCLGLQIYVIEF